MSSAISGIGKTLGTTLGSAAGGALGGLAINALFGGGKKKHKPDANLAQQQALLAGILPFINNPGAAVSQFRNQAAMDANRLADNTGGLLAEETGNPNALAATRLGMQNRATEAGNQFQFQTMSPEGRARAAMSVLPFYQGLDQQHLQRLQLGMQYRQPTFLNQLFSTGASALPFILNQRKNENQDYTYGSTNGGNVSPGMQFHF